MTSPARGRAWRLMRAVTPPPQWKVPVLVTLGTITGIGLLILRLSNATSYLSNDPATCINCHVMTPQFATWQHSSHARVATCTDCHVPHDNILRTYAFKAQDGMRHAYVFTFRLEPQVIQIREAGKTVVQENCIRCHDPLLDRVTIGQVTFEGSRHGQGLLCWSCHRETPHGTVNSLASTPYARVPRLSPALPAWLSGALEGRGQ